MIAEDERFESMALESILLTHYSDYIDEIIIVHNGQKAINMMKEKEDIYLIFMDIQMPFKNGIEASKEIRTFNTNVKIIMLTAYSEFDYARESIKNNVFDYITKPYSIETILECLENIIPINVSSKNFKIIEEVKRYILDNFNKEISLGDIARHTCTSKFHLSRIFKLSEGENIKDFIQKTRLEEAKKLLLQGQTSVEVSYSVGFNDPAYFGKVFKKVVGCTPSNYAKAIKS